MARDFPGGPVVENLPSSAGDAALIPGWELRPHMLQGNQARMPHPRSRAHAPQLEKARKLQQDPVQPKKKKPWFKDESMGYAEVSYSGLLLPCKSAQRCPWVAAIALGKAVGTVPSDPSIERELAQGKYVYGLLGSGEWFWHVCYGHQEGRSGRGKEV